MAGSAEVTVIDDDSDEVAYTPIQTQNATSTKDPAPARRHMSFEAMARSAGSIIFGVRNRAQEAERRCSGEESTVRKDASMEPRVSACAMVEDVVSPAIGASAPRGQDLSPLNEVTDRPMGDLSFDPAQAASRDDVEVKTEAQTVGVHAVSGPIAEMAGGNTDSDRLLSYNKKEGRDRCKLKLASQVCGCNRALNRRGLFAHMSLHPSRSSTENLVVPCADSQ